MRKIDFSQTIKFSVNILEFEEGYRESAYYCSEGYPTIGIGQRIGSQNNPLEAYGFQVSPLVAQVWLAETIVKLKEELQDYAWFKICNHERQAILISMGYQLGLSGLLGFKNMLAAIENYDWQEAHDQGLDSLWAKQTPERANRHMDTMLSGSLDNYTS